MSSAISKASHYECDDRVRVGKPRGIQDLQSIVRSYRKVKAVGVGHSWWKEQFCSGEDENAVNIVMTELPEVQQLFSGRDLKQLENSSDFPIKVNESLRTVTVAAGVPLRMLLDYLAEYESQTAPDGYTLPTFSWFIDQSVGGAVATSTHGSSLQHGSLSNLIVSMNVVLANGTLTSIDRNSNAHFFKAFMAHVGRLGVTTDLTMKIIPQKMHERRSSEIKFNDLVDQLKHVQMVYRRVKPTGDPELIYEALRPLDETQIFWYVPTSDIWKIDFQTIGRDEEPGPVVPRVRGFSDSEHQSVHEQQERSRVGSNVILRWGARGWANNFKATIKPRVRTGVFDTRKAYLTMSEDMNSAHAGFTGYDQFEVSIPIEDMADCLETVGEEIYGDAELWEGFRTPALIRFVSEEDAYLSNTHGGPRMFINLEDYVSYNSGNGNKQFDRVIELFRKKCNARLHWGKAGWTKHAACFDGATEYPATWCDFGCAVETLDPRGKFSGLSNVWRWNATKNGAAVEFKKTSRRKKDGQIFTPMPVLDEWGSPDDEFGQRVSFVRTSVSNHASFRVLEDLELEKLAIGSCLGRGAYGKVYQGEYGGIPLAIKVCEHDGAFLRNGNEPLETYLSRNIHHENVVKTLVNETRRCRGFLASMSELSPLNTPPPPPPTQRTGSSQIEISSSSETGSDEFSYIARTMEKSGKDDVYRTWIIMEYCEMGSLDQAIREKRFFKSDSSTEPNFVSMVLSALDIAEAMKYLHEQCIIHGDLKSQNVLLKKSSHDERGFYCKVGDFGLSRIIANKTHIDTFTCGTVSHSAPELFRRGLLTPAADVYSFGILLWELVSGTKPFNGAPHNGIVMAVTGGCRPIMPSYCPIALSRLINDCWQDSYRDRPTFNSITTRLHDMIQDRNSLLTSPGSTPHPASISLSVTAAQESNSHQLPDGVTQLETLPIDDSTKKSEDHQRMYSVRKVWTVPDLNELKSEDESTGDSPQSCGSADEQWHTASGQPFIYANQPYFY
eukprot:g5840.t1